MKVNFGPYPSRWRIDRISNLYYKLRYARSAWEVEDSERDRIDLAVDRFLDWWEDHVCGFVNRHWCWKRERKLDIRVDYHDVWNLDQTLALIIHPCLIMLKEKNHGTPLVHDEDLPEHLRRGKTVDEQVGPYNEADEADFSARWGWIMDELIWTFDQLKDGGNDDQFHHNSDQLKMVLTPIDGKPGSTVSFEYQKDPAKPKYWVDREGKKAHHARIANGLRLFGKYYQSLWD